jgi:hypothetical protein
MLCNQGTVQQAQAGVAVNGVAHVGAQQVHAAAHARLLAYAVDMHLCAFWNGVGACLG